MCNVAGRQAAVPLELLRCCQQRHSSSARTLLAVLAPVCSGARGAPTDSSRPGPTPSRAGGGLPWQPAAILSTSTMTVFMERMLTMDSIFPCATPHQEGMQNPPGRASLPGRGTTVGQGPRAPGKGREGVRLVARPSHTALRVTPQMSATAQAGPHQDQTRELPPGPPCECRGPGTRAIFLCFPKCLNRELEQQWGSQDSNHRSHTDRPCGGRRRPPRLAPEAVSSPGETTSVSL